MNSNYRIAELLLRLQAGETLDANEIVNEYGISRRTFQRDLADIRAALMAATTAKADLIAEANRQRFHLESAGLAVGTQAVVALSQLVIGSRAFLPEELDLLLDYLQSQLSAPMRETAKDIIQPARQSYFAVASAKPMFKLMQAILLHIKHRHLISFTYQASRNEPQTADYQAQPVGMFFDRHYFYVPMFVATTQQYRVFRLDRIQAIAGVASGLRLPYNDHFSLRDYRERTHLVAMGDLETFRFSYSRTLSTALDAFPQSKVVGHTEAGLPIIEARAQTFGAMLWLLGQGPGVRVLAPRRLVNDMTTALQQALAQYPAGDD